jgi:hypothetical protein
LNREIFREKIARPEIKIKERRRTCAGRLHKPQAGGADALTREEVYKSQLKALCVYDPAFDPEIKTLAQLERELTRAQKVWKNQAEAEHREKSLLDPIYAVIQSLRKEILSHREALGLTPKALQRIRGKVASTPETERTAISRKLDELKATVESYE